MHEVADVGPVMLIPRVQPHCGAEAFGLHGEPQGADLVRRQLALGALSVELGLEAVERDLAHDGVQPVLDLAGQERASLQAGGVCEQALEHQAFTENGGRFSQGQRRIG